MPTPQHLATQFRQVYFGGNWTAANFKTSIENTTLETAKKRIKEHNTILALCYHIHYYVKGTLDVFLGGDLEIRDKYSFDHPEISTEDEWRQFKANLWIEAEAFAAQIEQLPNDYLDHIFVEDKYGTYFRNISDIIEHTHYHLGQINSIKKLV